MTKQLAIVIAPNDEDELHVGQLYIFKSEDGVFATLTRPGWGYELEIELEKIQQIDSIAEANEAIDNIATNLKLTAERIFNAHA